MGVDFHVCPLCKETYPDCGEVRFCEGCETSFCGYCEPEVDIGETCPLCRYDEVSTEQVLEWTIANYGLPNKKALENACKADLKGRLETK